MLRILGRDTGAQFVLCELLTLKEIAQLHQCCRSWRRWINEGSLGSNRLLQFESKVPLSLRSSVWAPRYVQRLALGVPQRRMAPSVDADEDASEAEDDSPESFAAAFEPGRLDEIALRLLPRLNRLRALQLMLGLFDIPSVWPTLTSATLTSLVLDVRAYRRFEGDPFTPSFLRSLGGLPSLTSLRIVSDMVHLNFADLDFSVLPTLTQLQHLLILPERMVRCSPAQVDALVSCRSLTALDVGVWGAVNRITPVPFEETNLLAQLIHGRTLNGAAQLRNIGLGTLEWQTIVTPTVAKVLLTLHELESLEHVVWSCELTAEHWAQLSLFTRLHTIHIGTVSTELAEKWKRKPRASLQLDAPLQALQHCPLLTSVSLTGLAYSGCWLSLSAEHAALLAALPRLQSLSLRDVYLESLAPLSSAPALTHLMLDYCRGPKPFSMRSAIPPLPLLTSLTIEYDHDYQHDEPESDSDASPGDDPPSAKFKTVSAAMMQRLPLLQPRAFKHSRISTNDLGRTIAFWGVPAWMPTVLRI